MIGAWLVAAAVVGVVRWANRPGPVDVVSAKLDCEDVVPGRGDNLIVDCVSRAIGRNVADATRQRVLTYPTLTTDMVVCLVRHGAPGAEAAAARCLLDLGL